MTGDNGVYPSCSLPQESIPRHLEALLAAHGGLTPLMKHFVLLYIRVVSVSNMLVLALKMGFWCKSLTWWIAVEPVRANDLDRIYLCFQSQCFSPASKSSASTPSSGPQTFPTISPKCLQTLRHWSEKRRESKNKSRDEWREEVYSYSRNSVEAAATINGFFSTWHHGPEPETDFLFGHMMPHALFSVHRADVHENSDVFVLAETTNHRSASRSANKETDFKEGWNKNVSE